MPYEPDLLLVNANVLTMDRAGPRPARSRWPAGESSRSMTASRM